MRTLESVAKELNMSLGTREGWLKRAGLDGAGSAHVPTRGPFEHQLVQWREAFCAAAAANAAEQRAANLALRELQARHDQLQREMRRKDRALAEPS